MADEINKIDKDYVINVIVVKSLHNMDASTDWFTPDLHACTEVIVCFVDARGGAHRADKIWHGMSANLARPECSSALSSLQLTYCLMRQ